MTFRMASDTVEARVAKAAVGKELFIPVLVAAIGAAEIVLVFVHVGVGLLLEAIIVGTILVLRSARHDRLAGDAMVPLVLVPLLRILSLTGPLPGIAPIYWVAVVGAPLIVGGCLAARAARLTRRAVGLARTPIGPQLAIAALGIPAGLGAWATGASTSLIQRNAGLLELVLIAVVLGAFAGVTEEFVFRGVIQRGLTLMYPRSAVLLTAVLYGTSYLGSLSFGYATYMTLVGLGYGVAVQRTGSILGACASHAILIVGAFMMWPRLIG